MATPPAEQRACSRPVIMAFYRPTHPPQVQRREASSLHSKVDEAETAIAAGKLSDAGRTLECIRKEAAQTLQTMVSGDICDRPALSIVRAALQKVARLIEAHTRDV